MSNSTSNVNRINGAIACGYSVILLLHQTLESMKNSAQRAVSGLVEKHILARIIYIPVNIHCTRTF